MRNPHRGQPVATRGKPLHESRAVVVMMHGRGRDTDDILTLAERISEPDFTYLAPAAYNHTWYPFPFMEPAERNALYVAYALEVYDNLISSLVGNGIDRRRIVLAGFSQGACVTAEYAVRHAGRYGGILLFTGGLIGPPGTRWEYAGAFEETPIFLGTSDVDAFVPEERVRESAQIFQRMGAKVTLRVYPGMDHIVNDEEIAAARVILRGVIAKSAPHHPHPAD